LDKKHAVFFYGYGDKFRREWMQRLIGEPSRRLPDVDFGSAGGTSAPTSAARDCTATSLSNRLQRARSSASRINLTSRRRSHARSRRRRRTGRPFRLAMAARGDRLEPDRGDRALVEPGRELLVVSDADEAEQAYALCSPIRSPRRARAACSRAGTRRAHLPRAARHCSRWSDLDTPAVAELARG